MRKVCVALVVLACLACETQAAEKVDVKLLLQSVMPRSPLVTSSESVMSYRFKRDASTLPMPDLDDAMSLGRDATLQVVKTTDTVQGTKLVKMQEQFKGRTVLDGIVTIETDNTGQHVLDASGSVYRNIDRDLDLDHIRELDPEAALNACLDHNGDKYLHFNDANVKVASEILLDDEQTAYPAYFVQYLVQEEGDMRRPTCFVDARDGRVTEAWDALDSCSDCKAKGTGGNLNIGKIRYGELQGCLNVRRSEDGTTCYLENEFVRVVNYNFSAEETTIQGMLSISADDKEVASYDCLEIDDEVNGAFSPLLDALFYGTVTGKMYKDWYNMSAIGEVITLQVHYGVNVSNAYWTGKSCMFGDGGEKYHPLVSLDIVSHEIAHGVTERNSDLFYYKQWGGINEAFSDISGQAAEAFLARGKDWVTGADISKFGKPLRYFDNPEKDGLSISHVDNFTDDLNVHLSSGIFNRVFYILVHERGLPIKEVFGVFLHANIMYWHHMSTFASAACDVMKAAYDVGQNGAEFRMAFSEVGINICDDLEDHVVGLKPGKPYTDIKVSKTVTPSFVFGIVSEIVHSVIVNASSATSGEEVYIVVSNATWGEAEGDGADDVEVFAEGFRSLEFEVPSNVSMHVTIKLSSKSTELLNDVSLQASFVCVEDYQEEDVFLATWLLACKHFVNDTSGASDKEGGDTDSGKNDGEYNGFYRPVAV